MSWVRSGAIAALLSLVSAVQTASAAGTICPPRQKGTALTLVTLFDGPPGEQVSLAPDNSRKIQGADRSEWDVAAIARSERHLYVQCDYGAKGVATTLQQPASTARCTLLSRRGTLDLTCSDH